MLAGLEPDIEGLIVNRLSDPPVYVIAPIDRCYALTGAIKATWEGISGGSGVESAVTRFFEHLRSALWSGEASGEHQRRGAIARPGAHRGSGAVDCRRGGGGTRACHRGGGGPGA